MEEIEKQSRYLFVYDEACDLSTKVTVKIVKQPIRTALDEMFRGGNIVYRIDGSNIVLSRKRNDGAASSRNDNRPRNVKGKVVGPDGNPIVGATVVVKGTALGTSTAADGSYAVQIPVSVSEPVLSISFIGYEAVEMPVGERTAIDVTLKESSVGMDEVVVIGYGTVSKTDMTGSVANVRMSDIQDTPVLSVDQALQGRIAGADIMSTTGEPGATTSIRI